MVYAEELVKEFLVFRGFTNTLQAFVKELGTDIGKGFQVDKILDLVFSIYIPKFQAENLIQLLRFFSNCFSSHETHLISVISELDISIIRYYIIHAIQAGRKDKVIELFDIHGTELLQKDQHWASWFGWYHLSLLIYLLKLNDEIFLTSNHFMQQFHILKLLNPNPSSGYTFPRSGPMHCIYLLEIFSPRCLMALISLTIYSLILFVLVIV